MASRFERFRIEERARNPARAATDIRPLPGPAGPEIVSVDGARLVIGDTYGPRRMVLAMSTLALGFAPFIIWAIMLFDDRARTEADMLSLLDNEIATFGIAYIENLIAGGDPTLPLIWPDRSLSLREYLHYDWILSPGGWQANLPLAIFAVLFLAMGVAGAIYLARKRRAQMIFDRDRKVAWAIVGRDLLVCPWERLSYVNRNWEFGWLLFDPSGQKRLLPVRTGPTKGGSLCGAAGEAHAARIAAFMAKGADAIEGAPFHKHRPFAPGQERLPETIDATVEARLSALRTQDGA